MISNLRIETKGEVHPHFWRIYLNGEEITNYIRGFEIKMVAGDVARVKLELDAARLEFPDGLAAVVQMGQEVKLKKEIP